MTVQASHAQNNFVWSTELGRRFLVIAGLLYLAALGANLIYVLNNQCGFAFVPGRPLMFTGTILLLLVFEWSAHKLYGSNMTRQTGLWLLGMRLVLIEIAATLDCSFFANILYLLLPFLVYIFVGKWTASIMAITLTAWIAIKVGFFRCTGCQIDEYVTPVLQFGVGFLWSTVMGGLVKGVETNRAHARLLLTDLEQSHQQLKEYAVQVEELAATEERNRVARDIHDSVGHSLAVINVQLEKALVFQGRDPNVTERAIKDARRAAKEALNDVRASVRTLRQAADDFSFSEAVTGLVEQSGNDALKVDLEINGSETGYSKPALMTLYRAVQEGLTNVYKHSNASHVQILIQFDETSARMQLRDNGKGFHVDEIEGLSHHRDGQFGLQGIRERLELVGGEMSIESEAGEGSVLTVTVPRQRLTGEAQGRIQ
ncbi:MAG: sensor histidine kinase [Anaerolineales bacterium]|nr:sensor histidine kinase [Anaerolineales bacterium]